MSLQSNLALLLGSAAFAICVSADGFAQDIVDQPQANATYAQAVQALHGQDCQTATVLLKRYLQLAPATLARHPTLRDKIDHQIAMCSDKLCEDRGGHIILRGEKSTCSLEENRVIRADH